MTGSSETPWHTCAEQPPFTQSASELHAAFVDSPQNPEELATW
jgi:hypothetical protein